MSKKSSAAITAIQEQHKLNATKGVAELANPRPAVELHFHTQEEDYKGVVVTETKVLMSNAGYYIGHEYLECPLDLGNEFCYYAPYDRISGYYATREAAATDLELYKKALGH